MKIIFSTYLKKWLLLEFFEYSGEAGEFNLKFIWFRIISDAFIGKGENLHWELGIALVNDFYGNKFRWLFNKEACNLIWKKNL